MALDDIREGSRITCTGIGGSGGIVEGRVRKTTFSKRRHLFLFEVFNETATKSAVRLGEELKLWRRKNEMGGREIRGG